MASSSADGSSLEVDDQPGRPWRGEGFLARLTSRVGRSGTIALLLSPIGLLIISAVRLLIVSNYSTVTATAIASSGGYVDTLLGTALPLIPVFLPYVALIFMLLGRLVLAAIAIVAALLVSPTVTGRAAVGNIISNDWHHVVGGRSWIAIVALILFSAAFVVALLAQFATLGASSFVKTVLSVLGIALIPVALQLYPSPLNGQLYSQVIRQPWLPAEIIKLNTGHEFTGYVLSDAPGWVIVLRNSDRRVYFYPDTEVISRALCQLEVSKSSQPLITFHTATADIAGIPLCPAS